MMYRNWECGCGHKYTTPVEFSRDYTARLSGEKTAWCPKCGKAPLYGSAAYLRAPVNEVRAATNDPLVHAVIDWLTLPKGDK